MARVMHRRNLRGRAAKPENKYHSLNVRTKMDLLIDSVLVQKRFFEFVDQVVLKEIEILINEMIRRCPKLLCRLNLKNKTVARLVKQKIDGGEVSPFALMYDPEETFNETEVDEDKEWLEALDRKWRKKSQESSMGLVLV